MELVLLAAGDVVGDVVGDAGGEKAAEVVEN